MNSEEEIKAREQQSEPTNTTNETPELAGSGGGGDSGGLPIPSVDRNKAILAGAVVAALIALYLYRQRQADGSPDFASGGVEAVDDGADQNDAGDEEISISADPSDPLAADSQVTALFRQSGRIQQTEG